MIRSSTDYWTQTRAPPHRERWGLRAAVKLSDFGRDLKGNKVRFIESGKASGLMKAQSIILTRALADLRQGR